ncbi:3-hydroxyacyl-ACP dehydratase [Leadbetterella sp. DM7]|uniref:3-hydroxyacyl-ACP dehydratase n=1 Tax=Leadbetterella sp. DM7 TaxID=3235085 RepID=UPI00349EC442
MLAEKGFYTVNAVTDKGEGRYHVAVVLNKDHAIFKGHFPGNPVTPGACMLQVVKELTQDILGMKLMMTSVANVKFMALINPEKNPELLLELEIDSTEEEQIRVKNTTLFEDVTALKMSNTYKRI